MTHLPTVDDIGVWSRSCLVIIDMQPYFEAANHVPTIRNICRVVKATKKAKLPIVIVEYDSVNWIDPRYVNSRTHYRILNAVGNYPLARIVTKRGDDGADEILGAIQRFCGNQECPSVFWVTGVNLNACVKATVRGLMSRKPTSRVELIEDCCWTTDTVDNKPDTVFGDLLAKGTQLSSVLSTSIAAT